MNKLIVLGLTSMVIASCGTPTTPTTPSETTPDVVAAMIPSGERVEQSSSKKVEMRTYMPNQKTDQDEMNNLESAYDSTINQRRKERAERWAAIETGIEELEEGIEYESASATGTKTVEQVQKEMITTYMETQLAASPLPTTFATDPKLNKAIEEYSDHYGIEVQEPTQGE